MSTVGPFGIINSKTIKELGLVKGEDIYYNPHGVDLRVYMITFPLKRPLSEGNVNDLRYYTEAPYDLLTIDENTKIKKYHLMPNKRYIFWIEEIIDLRSYAEKEPPKPIEIKNDEGNIIQVGYIDWNFPPIAITAQCFPRSSLLRRGMTVHTAFWDFGYRGRGMLLVENTIRQDIIQGFRFAQIVFYLSQPTEYFYKGTYQGENLQEKEEKDYAPKPFEIKDRFLPRKTPSRKTPSKDELEDYNS